MIIIGEVTNGVDKESVITGWEYSPEDPWAVEVSFLEAGVTWHFALDLVREALSSDKACGHGDVALRVEEDKFCLFLTNTVESALILFQLDDVKAFVGGIDDTGSEELVAEELEEFLSHL